MNDWLKRFGRVLDWPNNVSIRGQITDPFGDWDRDGLQNLNDCDPRNPKKQDTSHIPLSAARTDAGNFANFKEPVRHSLSAARTDAGNFANFKEPVRDSPSAARTDAGNFANFKEPAQLTPQRAQSFNNTPQLFSGQRNSIEKIIDPTSGQQLPPGSSIVPLMRMNPDKTTTQTGTTLVYNGHSYNRPIDMWDAYIRRFK